VTYGCTSCPWHRSAAPPAGAGFNFAGRSSSEWAPSFKMGTSGPVKQPFWSQLEERLVLWLAYHPQVKSDAHSDLGPQVVMTSRLPTPKHAPFAPGSACAGKPHDSLPAVVGTQRRSKKRVVGALREVDQDDPTRPRGVRAKQPNSKRSSLLVPLRRSLHVPLVFL